MEHHIQYWIFNRVTLMSSILARWSAFRHWGLPEHRAVQVIFHRVVALIVLNAFGQTEVSDLHRALVFYQNITCRQVSVDVVSRTKVVHALEKRWENRGSEKVLQFRIISGKHGIRFCYHTVKYCVEIQMCRYLADLHRIAQEGFLVDVNFVSGQVFLQTASRQKLHDEFSGSSALKCKDQLQSTATTVAYHWRSHYLPSSWQMPLYLTMFSW